MVDSRSKCAAAFPAKQRRVSPEIGRNASFCFICQAHGVAGPSQMHQSGQQLDTTENGVD